MANYWYWNLYCRSWYSHSSVANESTKSPEVLLLVSEQTFPDVWKTTQFISQCQELFIHWQQNIPEDLKLSWFCSIQTVSLPVSYISNCKMRSLTVRVEHVSNTEINNIWWYLIFISFILFSITCQSWSSWRRKL